jgi:hypothetical protein
LGHGGGDDSDKDGDEESEFHVGIELSWCV